MGKFSLGIDFLDKAIDDIKENVKKDWIFAVWLRKCRRATVILHRR